jgi:hypothetical protein
MSKKTLKDLTPKERTALIGRVHEIVAGEDTTRKRAIKILSDEFPGINMGDYMLRKICDDLDLVWPRVDAATSSAQREQELARVLEQAGVFVREHRVLPAIPDKIKAVRIEDMGFRTPQEGVALFSDYHFGSRIDRRTSNGLAEYNDDIARARLIRWRNGILRFTQMNQLWVNLDTLHIMALGDELEGHGKMFGSQSLQMTESIVFQNMGFVEDMVEVILSFLERYKKISIIKVPGNHGRVAENARGAFTPDNFEILAWELIAERVRNACGGEWRTSENGTRHLEGGAVEFHLIYGAIAFVDILGWLCAARHGQRIKGLQATYTGAIDNKLRLNAIIGQVINYYFKGHLHEAQTAEHEIRGEIVQNGSFVGPSLLSLEMSRASANLPSQEFMLFHPKRGKTHHYRIHLADVEEIRQLEVIGR